jgi:hypothetical protein
MKKLLVLLFAFVMSGCQKEPREIQFFQEQLLLNAELVGTWRSHIEESDSYLYIAFSQDFTYVKYASLEDYENNKPTSDPAPYRLEPGKIHYHAYHYFGYEVKDDVLTIYNAPGSSVEHEDKYTVTYERVE